MKRLTTILISLLLLAGLCGCSKAPAAQDPDLTKIRSICNLATLKCYYHNVAKAEKKAGEGLAHLGEKDRKFWIEYTGTAKIGINMEKVDVSVEGETVKIKIPDAEVLEIGIDETSYNEDSFICSGDALNKNKITADDQQAALQEAQKTMRETVATDSRLLLTAQERAKDLIKNYILQLGEISGVEYTVEWIYEE